MCLCQPITPRILPGATRVTRVDVFRHFPPRDAIGTLYIAHTAFAHLEQGVRANVPGADVGLVFVEGANRVLKASNYAQVFSGEVVPSMLTCFVFLPEEGGVW